MADSKLILNIQDQVQRLTTQIKDLESCSNSIDPDEYADLMNDSVQQLKELEETLLRMNSGDMTLSDQFTATQEAIRAAIRRAFKAPKIIAEFSKKEISGLRQEIVKIEDDYRLRKITSEDYRKRKTDLLNRLDQCDTLTDDDRLFVSGQLANLKEDFEAAPSGFAFDESFLRKKVEEKQDT